jgi:3-methyladenine DNA glycosylase AlkC
MTTLKIPDAPKSIQKGFPLKMVLDKEAVNQLADNLHGVHASFNKEAFIHDALNGIDELGITQRSAHIADVMNKHLPETYTEAIAIILQSLTPPLKETEGNGLAVLFYMPHCSFVGKYGIDSFEISMNAQYELTKRFTCEYSMRPFIVNEQIRTMQVLYKWMNDENPHIRRLCSESTRPRLPWSTKINSFVKDPSPTIVVLEHLKNDKDLYVRRSVANHLGDIAKDHLDLVLKISEKWLDNASTELKWVIRHALRNPAKKGNLRALEIRKNAS